MKGGECVKLPFQIAVTKPGLYNVKGLRFQIGTAPAIDAGREISANNDTNKTIDIPAPPPFDEDELIPLQMAFVVTQAV